MALIFEDSEKVTMRKSPIPEKDREYYGALYNALEKVTPKNNLKNLKSLASTKKYNKKGADSKMNGDEQNLNYVSVEDAKKRMERMNPNDITQGGQRAYNFYKKTIQRARSQEKVSKVAPPKPTANDAKPMSPKVKKMKLNNSLITMNLANENRLIRESIGGDHPFFEYLSEYNEDYVFSEFVSNPHGKQSWGVLINPSMYKKALSEFTRFGRLTTFPTKYVYQWMGIIMKNTAILEANTSISGHKQYFPIDEFMNFLYMYFGEDREIEVDDNDDAMIEISPSQALKICNGEFTTLNESDSDTLEDDLNEYIASFNKGLDYNGKIIVDEKTKKMYWRVDKYNLLDLVGLYDWMAMPDGSDAFSDYGLNPLERIISEYEEELPAEKVLVIVNKALDVYHQRGDIASMFIEGGSKALSAISEQKKISRKKIHINENHLMALRNG